MKYDKDLHDALIYELRSRYKPAPSLPSRDFFRTVPRDEYSGTGWKNSKPELVIEVVELLKNRIAVNASLGNHVKVEDEKGTDCEDPNRDPRLSRQARAGEGTLLITGHRILRARFALRTRATPGSPA